MMIVVVLCLPPEAVPDSIAITKAPDSKGGGVAAVAWCRRRRRSRRRHDTAAVVVVRKPNRAQKFVRSQSVMISTEIFVSYLIF